MRPTLAALFLTLPLAAFGDNASFVAKCEKLATEARTQVIFEDKAVTYDNTRSLEELKRQSTSAANPNHSVLGLTHAVSTVRYNINTNILSESNGRVCAVPSLTLTLGFSEFEVFLARELKNDCRRKIVEKHEEEHVAVWRNHYRAGAQLLATVIKREFGQPLYFNRQSEAQAAIRLRAERLINPLLKNLEAGINDAHRQIDSPASYQYEANRMRACPG